MIRTYKCVDCKCLFYSGDPMVSSFDDTNNGTGEYNCLCKTCFYNRETVKELNKQIIPKNMTPEDYINEGGKIFLEFNQHHDTENDENYEVLIDARDISSVAKRVNKTRILYKNGEFIDVCNSYEYVKEKFIEIMRML